LYFINPSNAQLYPICHFLVLLGAHHVLHVSGLRVKCSCSLIYTSQAQDNSHLLYVTSTRQFPPFCTSQAQDISHFLYVTRTRHFPPFCKYNQLVLCPTKHVGQMSERDGDSPVLFKGPVCYPRTDTFHVVKSSAMSARAVGRVATDALQNVLPETLRVTGQNTRRSGPLRKANAKSDN
jgi:hypothetical protein